MALAAELMSSWLAMTNTLEKLNQEDRDE
jgi:hypothetical protein